MGAYFQLPIAQMGAIVLRNSVNMDIKVKFTCSQLWFLYLQIILFPFIFTLSIKKKGLATLTAVNGPFLMIDKTNNILSKINKNLLKNIGIT